jgi:hypothetical protein
MMRRFGSAKCKMLAEKLETPREFHQARDMGFVYFQGYFFCRSEVVIDREVPVSRLHYLRLLEMVCRSEIDMREFEKLLKQESPISYRLLRCLNSPIFRIALEIAYAPCHGCSGRAGNAALGAARRHRGRGRAEMQRTDTDGIGARPFLRTALHPAEIEYRFVPDGAAFRNGRHPRGQHGRAPGTTARGTRNQDGAARPEQ